MIKIGEYFLFKAHSPPCDSCGKIATKKIYAINDKGEYQVGIRICDDCFEKLKENINKNDKG